MKVVCRFRVSVGITANVGRIGEEAEIEIRQISQRTTAD